MDRTRRDSGQHNGIRVRRMFQLTFATKSVKNGSVPARAACPFGPQEQTSSGYTLKAGRHIPLVFNQPVEVGRLTIRTLATGAVDIFLNGISGRRSKSR